MTLQPQNLESECLVFQSLIGRVEINFKMWDYWKGLLFQSLIGRVEIVKVLLLLLVILQGFNLS